MSEFRRQRKTLQELAKARDAIRYKYNLLKQNKAEMEKALSETFKPIVEPLEKLVSHKQRKHADKHKDETVKREIYEDKPIENHQETFKFNETYDPDETLANETVIHETSFETADSDDDDDTSTDKYLNIFRSNRKSDLDQVYGVRKDGKNFMIGNLPIHFGNNNIEIKHVKYPKTEGLMELLIKKHPDRTLITSSDMQNYRNILEVSSAHRKRYNKDESIRTHNSKKFQDIINPLFKRDGLGLKKNETKVSCQSKKRKCTSDDDDSLLLPQYKIARRNTWMDYVYWDDPNELVDRLRLLIAERSAGNQSHTNEIHSIIEELREAGYIY